MRSSILITGGSGFVGIELLKEFNFIPLKKVFILVRDKSKFYKTVKLPVNAEVVEGDLEDTDSYIRILPEVDTVIHLAALTGKVSKKKYYDINFISTKNLVDNCVKYGVKKFLFVSTIAVTFKKKKRYFYALSKQKAEDHLKNSSLNFIILRPTMILGKGSPVFKGFSSFAGLPVIPMFGNGKVKVQPVHVRDVTTVIEHIVKNSEFSGDVIEAGGPEIVSLKSFVKLIAEKKGKKGTFFHLPMWILSPSIYLMDVFIYPVLPITFGQLASFRNDSTAEPDPVLKGSEGDFFALDKMIEDSLEGEVEEKAGSDSLRECKVFSNYLTGKDPSHFTSLKYLEFLNKVDTETRDDFDSLLMKIGARSPFFAKIADGYSRFFYPQSTLRKKLGYLFAIIETSPKSYKNIDDIGEKGKLKIFMSLFFRGIWFAFHLPFSAIFLLPLQVLKGKKPKKDSTEGFVE
ncbi:MAG: NAD-dependent epimerase/dehydratase family protein [Acidobacteriota bacterium]